MNWVRNFLILLLFGLSYSCGFCSLVDHLRPVENKVIGSQVRNVDFIYGINLDKRPNRWQRVLNQLSCFGIYPHRFSAIDGWLLPLDILNDVGITYAPGMRKCPNPRTYGSYFSLEKDSKVQVTVNLDESCYGRKFVSIHTSLGAIGCYLSHLSILEDAYNSGYYTIWVMEDDIVVSKNPHCISTLIESLDALVGETSWDILYTEQGYFAGFQDDRDKNLPEYASCVWRPDMIEDDTSSLVGCKDMEGGFVKVALKEGTRSMVIRRSGMKKILDYVKNQGIFCAIDVELPFVPNINMYAVKENIITSGGFPSDTKGFLK